ncbi:MAG: asparagine synthase (glutamine-hydrolyzing) [Candidatus Eremiobacteraeota bacterium]|nr:asparagine synthase (glutamine-hydrolyzing) [Candidatus Eremiobacteraeota bacterium]MCW5870377.1 asparagine synthase (glutamine-hydrolyzing) [Candidatus Eremiobacteraeota bacterium]
MCGIAGRFDLQASRDTHPEMLGQMGAAIQQRGPDESGWLSEPGVGLVSQRLAIVGLESGRQPIENEDGTVAVVCNGEFFDHREVRRRLEQRGHRFRTESDSEILVHLWEEYGEALFDHLRGQFAFALLDRRRRWLILARDRLGICPLYTCQSDGWFYFGSEIKALLASGQIAPRADPLALDHIFSFFAMGMRRTMFAGVQALLPGHYLKLENGSVSERQYWDLDFPDQGQELRGPDLAAQLGERLERSVAVRLRADVPVVSYLSGGVDSSLVASLASRQLGRPIPTFSIRILQDKLDEVPRALLTARQIGSQPFIVECGAREIAETYPALVTASESPVIDTSSAAIFRLAAAVRRQGYKVALTGEGADEALAGYPWFKVNRLLSLFDRLGLGEGLRRRFYGRANRRGQEWPVFARRYECMGGFHATSDLYGACSLSGYRVYSDAHLEQMGEHTACEDLLLNHERMRRWHPLNRSLYLGYKVMLAGLLMSHKGDRPAMANSVETRFPFLDEEVVAFCAALDPDQKLKGWFRDKHLLRTYAAGHLPAVIANRPKHIFRARYAGSLLDPEPAYVRQLLSSESLGRTGYFDPARVDYARSRLGQPLSGREDLAMVGVIATQLWHHLFLGGGLCELPYR